MLQQLVLDQLGLNDDDNEGEEEIITTTLIPTTTSTETEEEDDLTTTTITEIPTTTTTLHPHAIPLPFAFAPLHPLTEHENPINVTVERYMLKGHDVKPWTHSEPEDFNIIFAQPSSITNDKPRPLVTLLHDGPHEQLSGRFNMPMNVFLNMDMAVLLINYRGSIGMGDKSLESIIGKIGMVSIFIYGTITYQSLRIFLNKFFSFLE